jgi:hypothetical protein
MERLNKTYEEFKPLRNDAQIGSSLYHLAVMNRMRESLRQVLELFNRAGGMFEHMGNKLELIQNDSTNPRLCQLDEAKRVYSRARTLRDVEGREKTATFCRLDILNIPDSMCEFEIWRDLTFHVLITLFLACVVFCSLYMHRR